MDLTIDELWKRYAEASIEHRDKAGRELCQELERRRAEVPGQRPPPD